VDKVLQIFHETGIDDWAKSLQNSFIEEAARHMEEIAVLTVRKKPLIDLMHYLVQRDK
jgi:geranylgeranyl diphosphate synthase type II